MTRRWMAALVLGLSVVLSADVTPLLAQTPIGTAFSYQGHLNDAGAPANGTYDLRFILYDADAGGSQVGPTVTRDDVTVAGGLFTVSVDFGTVFDGNKRFLEIAVRPGTSGGGYTTLGTRQELTPTPNAVHASRASDATTVAGLSCAGGEVLKWSGGGWTCAPDIDTNSGGTVTSVGSGAGLTGGPVTTAGTLAVATGGITSAMVADGAITSAKIAAGAIGLAQIDTTQVQARVALRCPGGQYLWGVNPDGTVLCEPAVSAPTITVVDDPAGFVGEYASMAIGDDGLPVISYSDASAGALKVAKCTNAGCTGVSTITSVDDPANTVGRYSSIAIGSDGLPVISYMDWTAGALKVAKCANAACTGPSTITTVDDPANTVGYHTSIAIGHDELPVISYMNITALTLKVAKCANAACTGTSTITTVDDPANNVGYWTSIAIGVDSLPVISYMDSTAWALKVAKCVNADCTGTSTITTVDDPANSVGWGTAIAIGTDGLPVISYRDGTANSLKVAKCASAGCTGTSLITTVDDPANAVGDYTSIAIGTDGLPVIGYRDNTAGAVKVAKCANADCTAASAITTVDDPTNAVGLWLSLKIGNDSLPVIAYHDQSVGTLKVAKCGTRTCQ